LPFFFSTNNKRFTIIFILEGKKVQDKEVEERATTNSSPLNFQTGKKKKKTHSKGGKKQLSQALVMAIRRRHLLGLWFVLLSSHLGIT
jgi:hypothetical protein